MSLIIADSENTFDGAIVSLGDKKCYVYKVNKKTMYCGPDSYVDVMSKWKNKPKDLTWKELMVKVKAEMVPFGSWMISSEEVSRKESFEKTSKLIKKQKPRIPKQLDEMINSLYKLYENSLTDSPSKSNYRTPIQFGSDRITVIAFDKSKIALINMNGELIFYDMNNKICIDFIESEHKNGKNILWDKIRMKNEKVS